MLDSLPADRSEALNNIREYLSQEWKQRVNFDFAETFHTFDNSEMKVVCPVLPTQQNGFDCGVFLLTYSEKLFERSTIFIFYKFKCTDLDNIFLLGKLQKPYHSGFHKRK